MRYRPHLSPTESRVVGCILEGMGNVEIGRELKMSKRMVKAHKARVFIKYDIGDKWIKSVRLVWLLSGGWDDTRGAVTLP